MSVRARKSTKALVHARDKVCQRCGTKGSRRNKLEVHHILPRKTHPRLVNDTSNCELLCRKCHLEHHREVGYP